ncbi:MAG: hypothetical protein LC645_07320 [Geobacteraceae bacterium]|nr:hypothetical protein [Geobacteraceae bacterium]
MNRKKYNPCCERGWNPFWRRAFFAALQNQEAKKRGFAQCCEKTSGQSGVYGFLHLCKNLFIYLQNLRAWALAL